MDLPNVITGDEKRIDLLDPAWFKTLAGFFLKLGRAYFRSSITGLKHIPRKGPALIVSNHGILAMETPFFVAEWRNRPTDRPDVSIAPVATSAASMPAATARSLA